MMIFAYRIKTEKGHADNGKTFPLLPKIQFYRGKNAAYLYGRKFPHFNADIIPGVGTFSRRQDEGDQMGAINKWE